MTSRHVPVLAAVALLVASLATSSLVLAQEGPRVIVRDFTGWHASQARAAAAEGLAGAFTVVDESEILDASARTAADARTQAGMQQIAQALRVQLILSGQVEDTSRRSTTTLWVTAADGRELGRTASSGPINRDALGDIGQSALQLMQLAQSAMSRPAPVSTPAEQLAEPTTDTNAPPVDEYEDMPEEDDGTRWIQPMVRALVGVRIRNRLAVIQPDTANDRFDSDFFGDLQLQAEVRPFATATDALRGLYANVSAGVSVGLGYLSAFDATRQAKEMQVYNFGLDLGYAFYIEEMVELAVTLGYGIDGVSLANHLPNDFPSTTYQFIRPAVQGRVRLLENLLALEAGFGGRIAFDMGEMGTFYGPTGSSGGGIDLGLGLAGQVDPGFSWAARFTYTGYWLGFSGPPSTSGTDEAFGLWLLVGWSF